MGKKVDKKEFIGILQKQGWYSFEDSGIDFSRALPRGVQSIIEGMVIGGVYKMKGVIIYKEGSYPEGKDGVIINTIKIEGDGTGGDSVELGEKIAQLEKEVVERKENWNKIHKQMEKDDIEYLTLEKKYKELQKGLLDVDGQGSSVQRYGDKQWMTIGELKIGYIELVNMVKSIESGLKTTTEKFDSELKKQVGETIKKNEYLQEDITKMEKEVLTYKQEASKSRRYFYKFKVAYDMMILAGAKDPDRNAVGKEVDKFEEEKQNN